MSWQECIFYSLLFAVCPTVCFVVWVRSVKRSRSLVEVLTGRIPANDLELDP